MKKIFAGTVMILVSMLIFNVQYEIGYAAENTSQYVSYVSDYSAGLLDDQEVQGPDFTGYSAEEILDYYISEGTADIQEELILNGHKVQNITDFVHKLENFTALTRVEMCDCGVPNDQMDSLGRYFPDTKFVWMIRINRWSIRTDQIAFSTYQGHVITYKMTSRDAQQFRYCTDLVALDLGHNSVSDVRFLRYTPQMKLLILVDNSPLSDIHYLKYTPKLMYLEFFVDRVSDLSVFQELPELVDINIGYNPISDITYLENIPKLERLWIECTHISYADYQKLCEIYPDAKIVYYGSGSVDQGWRNHERYWAMRDTFRNNYVNEIFTDGYVPPEPE